jgi:poly-gamma-glutamate synthesis protein (capsule biosynthesis protein)
MDPYSGTPANAYDARMKAQPRPGYPEHKWFAYDQKYWISILPYMEFEGDNLSKLELYPIELGQEKSRSQKGRPMLAKGELAEKILQIITELSKPYGTLIVKKDNIGIVNL